MTLKREEEKGARKDGYRKSKTKKIPLEVKTTLTKRSVYKIFQKIKIKL